MQIEEWKTDFIVVGSGIAGLFGALNLAKKGRVILLSKCELDDGNSEHAQGGIAAVWNSNDTFKEHIDDTLKAGDGLSHEMAVEILVHEGPNRIRELLELGVNFDSDERGLLLTREGGHQRPRVLHSGGDATGHEVEQVLLKRVKEDSRIKCVDNFFCTDILTAEGEVRGIAGFWGIKENRVIVYSCHVILASGGYAQLYPENTNPPVTLGDGVAISWGIGARVADMEFIQFHPTVLSIPNQPRFLLTEALRGEGAQIVNLSHERFMPRYHPMAELAPRDTVSRFIFSEMERESSSYVFLDSRMLGKHLLSSRFPTVYSRLASFGLFMEKDLIPIAPAAHYSMGGVYTDIYGKTNVRGLYAAGEVACTGVHGANRLASNSLLECLVFSARATQSAILDWSERKIPSGDFKKTSWTVPISLNEFEIKKLVGANLGITRERSKLLEILAALNSPLEQRSSIPIFSLSPKEIRLRNITTIAALVATMAISRTESRGAHFRSDFPDKREAWVKRQTILFTKLEGEKCNS